MNHAETSPTATSANSEVSSSKENINAVVGTLSIQGGDTIPAAALERENACTAAEQGSSGKLTSEAGVEPVIGADTIVLRKSSSLRSQQTTSTSESDVNAKSNSSQRQVTSTNAMSRFSAVGLSSMPDTSTVASKMTELRVPSRPVNKRRFSSRSRKVSARSLKPQSQPKRFSVKPRVDLKSDNPSAHQLVLSLKAGITKLKARISELEAKDRGEHDTKSMTLLCCKACGSTEFSSIKTSEEASKPAQIIAVKRKKRKRKSTMKQQISQLETLLEECTLAKCEALAFSRVGKNAMAQEICILQALLDSKACTTREEITPSLEEAS